MVYRPSLRRSSLAVASRWIAALAIPVLVVAVVGHRFVGMTTDHAVTLSLAAFLMAGAALLLGLLAAALVWHDGRYGARHAVIACLYAVIALVPAAWVGWETRHYPRVVDVGTDAIDPPLYRTIAFRRVGLANSPTPPSLEERQRVRALTPDLVTRRFTVGTDLLFAVTKKQVEQEGWTVAEMLPPRGDGDQGRIEAETRSFVFGFRDDVVIRILPEPNGARIDLRASARWGDHDLGRNARRIRAFLDDLDKAVVATYGG